MFKIASLLLICLLGRNKGFSSTSTVSDEFWGNGSSTTSSGSESYESDSSDRNFVLEVVIDLELESEPSTADEDLIGDAVTESIAEEDGSDSESGDSDTSTDTDDDTSTDTEDRRRRRMGAVYASYEYEWNDGTMTLTVEIICDTSKCARKVEAYIDSDTFEDDIITIVEDSGADVTVTSVSVESFSVESPEETKGSASSFSIFYAFSMAYVASLLMF